MGSRILLLWVLGADEVAILPPADGGVMAANVRCPCQFVFAVSGFKLDNARPELLHVRNRGPYRESRTDEPVPVQLDGQRIHCGGYDSADWPSLPEKQRCYLRIWSRHYQPVGYRYHPRPQICAPSGGQRVVRSRYPANSAGYGSDGSRARAR